MFFEKASIDRCTDIQRTCIELNANIIEGESDFTFSYNLIPPCIDMTYTLSERRHFTEECTIEYLVSFKLLIEPDNVSFISAQAAFMRLFQLSSFVEQGGAPVLIIQVGQDRAPLFLTETWHVENCTDVLLLCKELSPTVDAIPYCMDATLVLSGKRHFTVEVMKYFLSPLFKSNPPSELR